MHRGTTQPFRLTLDIDTAYLTKCWVTFKQCGLKITKTGNEVVRCDDGKSFDVTLTQEDTLSFVAGVDVKVQMRAITTTGEAVATGTATEPVEPILMDGVIG